MTWVENAQNRLGDLGGGLKSVSRGIYLMSVENDDLEERGLAVMTGGL